MDIEKLLNKTPCPCGRDHRCDIAHIVIASGAISHLPALTEMYGRILLVADQNTFAAAGEQVLAALKGKAIRQVIFPGSTMLIPDEAAIAAVTEALGDAQLLVGIGSGVIQDLCKYVSLTSKLPYQIVATAPSMDGYASTGAAMILGGMKVTVAAGVPEAIIADTDILKDAPMDMIRAGYGDIVGKFSALNDWKLSHAVNGEYFCQEIYDLTFRCLEKTLQLAEGLQKRNPESIQVLMEALVTVGIAMSFAGSSRPASGSEHHLSHYFEITGILRNEPYFSHGLDVAYSTVVTARIREHLLSRSWPVAPCRPSDREASIRRIYGPVAEDCIRLQEKAGWYDKDLFSVYKEKESQLRTILAEMPSSGEIEKMLAAAGIHMTAFHQLYSRQKRADALLYAKELKDRYSVLWLYYELFGESEHDLCI